MKLFELLKQLRMAATTAAHGIRFNKKSDQDRNLIALYCSILELASSIIILIDNRASAAVPIVFRSLLEAYVDFKNLMKDSSYSQFIQAAYLSEWSKILKEASQKASRFLVRISAKSDLAQVVATQEKQLKDLEMRGFKRLNHFERFDLAGMANEYRSIYNQVCSQSHNNLRALIDRHIEIEDEDFRVILFKKRDLSSYLTMYFRLQRYF